MKIRVNISADEDFDADTLIDWINDQFDIENMASGSNMVAELEKKKTVKKKKPTKKKKK